MPALQVREFPDELYDELKEYAASQHRSMAQQVIVAVEQMLACDEGAQAGEPRACAAGALRYASPPFAATVDTEAERAARAKRREELFRQAEEERADLPKDLPSAVEMLRQVRDERDVAFEALSSVMSGGAVKA